jgi:hypothetical protein
MSDDTIIRLAAVLVATGVIGGALHLAWRVARAVFRIEAAVPELIELGHVLAVSRARGNPVDLQALLDESPQAHQDARDALRRVVAVEGDISEIRGSLTRIDQRLDVLVQQYDAEHQRLRQALKAAIDVDTGVGRRSGDGDD